MADANDEWIDLRAEQAHTWGLQVPRDAIKSRIIYERGDYIVIVHACESGLQVATYHKYGHRDIYGRIISLYGLNGLRTKKASTSTPSWFDRFFGQDVDNTKEYTIADAMGDAMSYVNRKVEAGRAALDIATGAIESSRALSEAEVEVERLLKDH